MPDINQFDGIVIFMDCHDLPPPHIHACCADCEAIVDIASMQLQKGCLPPQQAGLELAPGSTSGHIPELLDNWERAQWGLPVYPAPRVRRDSAPAPPASKAQTPRKGED